MKQAIALLCIVSTLFGSCFHRVLTNKINGFSFARKLGIVNALDLHVIDIESILITDIHVQNDNVSFLFDSADAMFTDMFYTYTISKNEDLQIKFYGFVDIKDEYASHDMVTIQVQNEQYKTISIVDDYNSKLIYSE